MTCKIVEENPMKRVIKDMRREEENRDKATVSCF